VIFCIKNGKISYLNYFSQQIDILREYRITPIFVFDGCPLPAKRAVNEERRRTRSVAKEKARTFLESGDTKASFSQFTKAVTVTNEMTRKLMNMLKKLQIQFYVAPYEADAQLAFLSKAKLVDAVISEDSDCIPYGCKKVLLKWSGDGWACELTRKSLGANEDLSFLGWSEEMVRFESVKRLTSADFLLFLSVCQFIQFCVLAGCDYCPSVPGVGIITAYKFINEHKSPQEVQFKKKQNKKKTKKMPLKALPVNIQTNAVSSNY
jgi:exonuclease-1